MSRGGRGGFGRGGGAPLSVAAILYLIARPFSCITGRGFGRGGGPPRDFGPPDTVFGAYLQSHASLKLIEETLD